MVTGLAVGEGAQAMRRSSFARAAIRVRTVPTDGTRRHAATATLNPRPVQKPKLAKKS